MVASGDNVDATSGETVAAVASVDVELKVPNEEAVGDKRKERSDDVDAFIPGDESDVPVDASLVVPKSSEDPDATEDESIHEVMANIKDSAGADVTFEAPTDAVTPPDVVKPESEAEAAAVEAAVNGAAAEAQQYNSKRMSRVSFNSWFDFDAYFELYMQETFQPFRMRSSCSVEAYRRNQQKVMLNNKSSRGRRAEFPDEAIHHHRIYMCTHAMKARCRGANTRPGQKYRGIGCTAKINVKITPADNAAKYMVIVTDQVVTHNHPVSREIYEAYPDVLLKMMRRSQLSQTMLGHPPTPKFETPGQAQKYERAMGALQSVAEAMARLPDEDYEQQLTQLQRIYATSPDPNVSSVV
ncbi:hypothetical protein BBO99_00002027 [Phytophthora kernoviae]|uniref:FAR1 domain-containing protein n=2 Tax=Phytophthora kernoviae TaxID=325452 RepID=A0A3R7HPH2_9STRA|nr:hypothetical protein G195_000842 [Phytophthora kernoviae 00238/432]KAG2532776.1 hypothetical protein JM16_000032 [Phytophthora kernoviae]KAG2533627.1 hypothetical protein JM18_000034 [Phytophthora kernoviae]RLN11098.1 hypothetical protein BBI17_000186 [Phytophthora kernoviae]RLN86144.1 hypothetical protein BBO99_00002027 [Phytophthora kernoviae]